MPSRGGRRALAAFARRWSQCARARARRCVASSRRSRRARAGGARGGRRPGPGRARARAVRLLERRGARLGDPRGEAEVDGFDWEDDRAVAALRARLRRTLARRRGDERDGRADLAPPIDPPRARPAPPPRPRAPPIRSRRSQTRVLGRPCATSSPAERFGYGATPRAERARLPPGPRLPPQRGRAYDRRQAVRLGTLRGAPAWSSGARARSRSASATSLGRLRAYFKRGEMAYRAARLRDHLAALGPAFVKIGQVLSTRADLLPPVYCRNSRSSDDLPPAPRRHATSTPRARTRRQGKGGRRRVGRRRSPPPRNSSNLRNLRRRATNSRPTPNNSRLVVAARAAS